MNPYTICNGRPPRIPDPASTALEPHIVMEVRSTLTGAPAIGAAAVLAALLASGCGTIPTGGPAAQVQLQPTKGSEARGRVEFRQRDGGLEIVATVSGLTPGQHGFHIHEKGDCSAPDATSAGGHFNPTGQPHGHPAHDHHHLGDMPMLQADASGSATLKSFLPGLSLDGKPSGILGRAVIVHADPDDFRTQPTGNSGARVACGVVAAR
jgi:superoxide dismutase, Cu-Zn family